MPCLRSAVPSKDQSYQRGSTLQQLQTLGPPDLQPVPALDHQRELPRRDQSEENQNKPFYNFHLLLVNVNSHKINFLHSKMAVNLELEEAVVQCNAITFIMLLNAPVSCPKHPVTFIKTKAPRSRRCCHASPFIQT